ncbi:unnamed protein product [Diatraea saccharalis]|uniref:Uncharacterized protein n=1 Tax=Diatraea saccharalis TaxID=40085 RepID=A0A9N9WIR5_9NEOP|nr:unnamed protein product [Diatraea saccharalis]
MSQLAAKSYLLFWNYNCFKRQGGQLAGVTSAKASLQDVPTAQTLAAAETVGAKRLFTNFNFKLLVLVAFWVSQQRRNLSLDKHLRAPCYNDFLCKNNYIPHILKKAHAIKVYNFRKDSLSLALKAGLMSTPCSSPRQDADGIIDSIPKDQDFIYTLLEETIKRDKK